MTRAAKPASQPVARRQSPKSGPGRAGTAGRYASSHRAKKTAGRAGSGDSGRMMLSLGPEGLRLEPFSADPRSVVASAPWDALTDAERIERLGDEVRRYAEALRSERATVARLAALWAEYDGLTRHDWQPNRVVTLRAEIREVLEVKP